MASEAKNMPAKIALATAGPLPSATLVSRQVSTAEAVNMASENTETISTCDGASSFRSAGGAISHAISAEPQLLATT